MGGCTHLNPRAESSMCTCRMLHHRGQPSCAYSWRMLSESRVATRPPHDTTTHTRATRNKTRLGKRTRHLWRRVRLCWWRRRSVPRASAPAVDSPYTLWVSPNRSQQRSAGAGRSVTSCMGWQGPTPLPAAVRVTTGMRGRGPLAEQLTKSSNILPSATHHKRTELRPTLTLPATSLLAGHNFNEINTRHCPSAKLRVMPLPGPWPTPLPAPKPLPRTATDALARTRFQPPARTSAGRTCRHHIPGPAFCRQLGTAPSALAHGEGSRLLVAGAGPAAPPPMPMPTRACRTPSSSFSSARALRASSNHCCRLATTSSASSRLEL
jgi:hypothetical protein